MADPDAFDDEEGDIEDILPIDYQLIHYGCPVFDFMYFIFLSTERDFRKEHLTNLKDLYYETLSNFLKYFNIDPDIVYSRKEFEKVYKEKLDYGLMIAMVFLPYVFVSEDHLPDMSDPQAFQVNDKFKDRFRGIIEDFIEWGYI